MRTKQAKPKAVAPPPPSSINWWPWATLAAALVLAFEAFGPALGAAFVFDDLSLPYGSPNAAALTLKDWLTSPRPMLFLTYFFNYQWSASDPYFYHVVNVLLHVCVSALIALITGEFLKLAKVATGVVPLSLFAGIVFLLHPLQTESVNYIASRSEVLSVLFFMAALLLYLRAPREPLGWPRSIAIFLIFIAALASKEHMLTLPILIVLCDWYWSMGGLKRNGVLYGLLAAAAVTGGAFVFTTLRNAPTAGLNVAGITPLTYFFTQGRVIWSYLRLILLPTGLNLDPDVALSHGPLDHGALFGLLALLALAAAAWIYRKQFPLAAFGVAIFLLLLAPTSSFVPIADVMAERRVYLPFLGILLIAIEFLRRLKPVQIGAAAGALALVYAFLTYQRSVVWSTPELLWRDTVAKSPNKARPWLQLARIKYGEGHCDEAVRAYESAAKTATPDYGALLNWGLALDCMGRPADGVEKLIAASKLERSAHVMSQIGMLYAKQMKYAEALAALETAESLDANFVMTYVYRGGIHELANDKPRAEAEYRKALRIDPSNRPAQEGLARTRR